MFAQAKSIPFFGGVTRCYKTFSHFPESDPFQKFAEFSDPHKSRRVFNACDWNANAHVCQMSAEQNLFSKKKVFKLTEFSKQFQLESYVARNRPSEQCVVPRPPQRPIIVSRSLLLVGAYYMDEPLVRAPRTRRQVRELGIRCANCRRQVRELGVRCAN